MRERANVGSAFYRVTEATWGFFLFRKWRKTASKWRKAMSRWEYIGSASSGSDSDSFIDDSEVDEVSISGEDEKLALERNIGEECLSGAQTSGWQCCFCCPSLLKTLTSQLEQAIGSGDLIVSSSDSDSDSSDLEIDGAISSKRRRKKKIRRMIDDNESGEETRRKIAIEKNVKNA